MMIAFYGILTLLNGLFLLTWDNDGLLPLWFGVVTFGASAFLLGTAVQERFGKV